MKTLKINYIFSIFLCLIGLTAIFRYASYENPVAFRSFCIIETIVILLGIGASISAPLIFYPILSILLCILNGYMNYFGHLLDNKELLLQCIIALAASLTSLVHPLEHLRKWKKGVGIIILTTLIVLCSLGYWLYESYRARNLTGIASSNIWEVPSEYDTGSAVSQCGTIKELSYKTYAYATDSRCLTKKACIYLPYGYDAANSYDILYLMHGTGDDENYWLKTFSYNKDMIDTMIARGDIKPMIIVTPSFYVEDDCSDDLDQLTYSFEEELRNDLIPAVESQYSTYATECTKKGFTESRDHRAFAGLSRGAVTMYHSALCGSLDYFSWFGAFSGSRTDASYFKEHLQSDLFQDYSIHYLYVSSGTFDFALPGQLKDYKELLQTDSRFISGENTCFDVYPMRYHSIGSWHLALYNFLPHIFQ